MTLMPHTFYAPYMPHMPHPNGNVRYKRCTETRHKRAKRARRDNVILRIEGSAKRAINAPNAPSNSPENGDEMRANRPISVAKTSLRNLSTSLPRHSRCREVIYRQFGEIYRYGAPVRRPGNLPACLRPAAKQGRVLTIDSPVSCGGHNASRDVGDE